MVALAVLSDTSAHLQPDEEDAQQFDCEQEQQLSQRTQALWRCFQRLDLDKSGYIEVAEMRNLAKQITPQTNLEDATDMLRMADKDHDQRVSLEEFLGIMLPLSESMEEPQFLQHITALLGQAPHEAFNEPGYKHPAGSRQWLSTAVVPSLREGLQALVEHMVQERTQLAAGMQWEEGPREGEGGQAGTQYLPHGWKPLQPLRWLGEWLLQQLPTPPASPIGVRGASPVGIPSFCSLTREEKVAIAFQHLDRDGSGYLDTQELLSVAGKLHKDQDMAYAEELLQDMDLDKNGRVELNEYIAFVKSLTEVLTDDEFDAAIHKVLGSSHLSFCNTRADKLAFLFREVDVEGGGISFDELTHLVHRMDPTATPWKIQATLDHLHIASDKSLGLTDFVAALTKLLAHCSTEELDGAIVAMVEGRKLGAAVHPADPLLDVEPLRFRELLEQMALPEHVLQIGTMDVIDAVDGNGRSPLLLIDARSPAEVAVSSLPGALNVPVVEDPSDALGWKLSDLEPLRRQLAACLTQGSRLPRLVAFCNTGTRSAPASVLLSKTLGVAVRSMCGGIIAYYNQGGHVRDPSGAEVQAIHPGSADLKQYVTRPSSFKFA